MEKTIDFESAMKRLEEIVEKLDSEKTTLDESIKLYEEGKKLIVICNDKLNNAQNRIKMVDADGNEKEIKEQDLK